jgi:FG-GAP repeat
MWLIAKLSYGKKVRLSKYALVILACVGWPMPAIVSQVHLGSFHQVSSSIGVIDTMSDFNKDGLGDLAVGVPFGQGAGFVEVHYGSPGGSPHQVVRFDEDTVGIPDKVEAGDRFGLALAQGDFNGDTYADLAVGVPGEDGHSKSDVGAIHVLYGAPTGLGGNESNDYWRLNDLRPGSRRHHSEAFGFDLVVGNFGFSPHDDLAVSSGERVHRRVESGAVYVTFGADEGLVKRNSERWTQDSRAILGKAEELERFGVSLAAGNLGRSKFDDLAIGSYESIRGVDVAGGVNVIFGGKEGLTADGNLLVSRDTGGVFGEPKSYASFGLALAIDNLGHGAYDDLAVGSPGERVAGRAYAGAAYLFYGNRSGTLGKESQRWTKNSPGIPGRPRKDDLFAQSLLIGRMNMTAPKDLVIGAYDRVRHRRAAGSVTLIYDGSASRMPLIERWSERDGIQGRVGAGDLFGHSLASVNINGDEFCELVVGVPFDDVSTQSRLGSVRHLNTKGSGITTEGSQRRNGPHSGSQFGHELAGSCV